MIHSCIPRTNNDRHTRNVPHKKTGHINTPHCLVSQCRLEPGISRLTALLEQLDARTPRHGGTQLTLQFTEEEPQKHFRPP